MRALSKNKQGCRSFLSSSSLSSRPCLRLRSFVLFWSLLPLPFLRIRHIVLAQVNLPRCPLRLPPRCPLRLRPLQAGAGRPRMMDAATTGRTAPMSPSGPIQECPSRAPPQRLPGWLQRRPLHLPTQGPRLQPWLPDLPARHPPKMALRMPLRISLLLPGRRRRHCALRPCLQPPLRLL